VSREHYEKFSKATARLNKQELLEAYKNSLQFDIELQNQAYLEFNGAVNYADYVTKPEFIIKIKHIFRFCKIIPSSFNEVITIYENHL